MELGNVATKWKIIIPALVLVIIIGIAGVIVWQQFYQPKGTIAGPITVVDDVGRNVTITTYPPERIVSLAPSCTEILFELGLGSKVVGVDEYSDYPPEVQEKVKAGNLTTVGSFAEISIETVVGLQPDLVLATGGVQRLVAESLEGLGKPVVVLYPKKFDGVLADISLVGKATGQTDEAEVIVTDLREKAQEIADKTRDAPRPRIYVEYFFNGGYWSFGSESFADELIYKAGGVNVFSGFAKQYISTSTEEVLKADPEIIIISKGAMAIASGLTPEVIKGRQGWSETYAVQNDQIYEIDESIISREGPRLIKGLEEFAKVIHPELFKEA
jgi:iron complex transport system substrate-binding protein